MTPFEQSLQNFQSFATSVNPSWGEQIREIIAVNYVSHLGAWDDPMEVTPAKEFPVTAQQSVADKIASSIDTVAGIYLKTQQQIDDAKLRSAQLKLQAAQATAAAITPPVIVTPTQNSNMNTWLMIGGLALGAMALVRR